MKRCPQCSRVYDDAKLNFCLDDGEWLVDIGQPEPATAILPLDHPEPLTTLFDDQDLGSRKTQLAISKRSVVLIVLATAVFGIAGVGSYFIYQRFARKQISSIAVMPFANDGANADLEYLSDGMTESLISSLSRVPDLNVKARTSVFRYKGRDIDPTTVASELSVDAILSGHLVARGSDLILNVELIDGSTQTVLWSETYNRKLTELISLQSQLAHDVSQNLKSKLASADAKAVEKSYTENTEAYRLYLEGRFYLNKRTLADFRKAIDLFNRAVALDPQYALAFSGLADSYALMSIFEGMPPTEAMPAARDFANRAIAIEPTIADPHNTLGLVYTQYDWDFARAEQEYKRSIELDPKNPVAHQWYGQLLAYQRRFEESFAENKIALDLDPLSLPINWNYAIVLYYARKYDESVAQYKKTLELDPNFRVAHVGLAQVDELRQNYPECVEEYARSEELAGNDDTARIIRDGFRSGGWPGFLKAVTADSTKTALWRLNHVRFAIELGQKDKAIKYFEDAIERRDSDVRLMNVEPMLDEIRDDPRFVALLKRVKL
jgi:TolB-like protein